MSSAELFNLLDGIKSRVFVRVLIQLDELDSKIMGTMTDLEQVVFCSNYFEEELVDDSIKCFEEWPSYLPKDFQPGHVYNATILFSVQQDGDDFRDWSWLEIEHMQLTHAYDPSVDSYGSDSDGIDIFLFE